MRSASNIRMKNVKDENSLAELTKHRGNTSILFYLFFFLRRGGGNIKFRN